MQRKAKCPRFVHIKIICRQASNTNNIKEKLLVNKLVEIVIKMSKFKVGIFFSFTNQISKGFSSILWKDASRAEEAA